MKPEALLLFLIWITLAVQMFLLGLVVSRLELMRKATPIKITVAAPPTQQSEAILPPLPGLDCPTR